MTEDDAKERLSEILVHYRPGSVLILLADVLGSDTPATDAVGESLRDVVGALTVVGLGLDLLYPSEGV